MIPVAFKPYLIYAKVAAVLILLLSLWLHGHKVGSENMDSKWQVIFSKQQLQAANARVAALEAARKQEQDAQARVSIAESIAYSALQEKQHELEKLRAATAAGDVRLRVKAVCPSVPAAPGSAQDPGVDHGGAAFLDPAAEPAYFALRAGIEQVEGQLAGCQGVLRAIAPSSH